MEIGPHPVLSAMATLAWPSGAEPPASLASMRRGSDADGQAALALAALYAKGAKLDFAALHGGESRRKLALPTYPFQRQRYWVEARKRRYSSGRRHRPSPARRSDRQRAWRSDIRDELVGRGFALAIRASRLCPAGLPRGGLSRDGLGSSRPEARLPSGLAKPAHRRTLGLGFPASRSDYRLLRGHIEIYSGAEEAAMAMPSRSGAAMPSPRSPRSRRRGMPSTSPHSVTAVRRRFRSRRSMRHLQAWAWTTAPPSAA